ncbi:MAG: OmpA family protein [Thermoguttaceae bacterium]
MPCARWWGACCKAGLLWALSGCSLWGRPELAALKEQNRTLLEENRAALGEIENLRSHARQTEDRLSQAEQQLALLAERADFQRQQLANYQQEREALFERVRGLAWSHPPLRPETRQRLAELSGRFPAVQLDPDTGIARLQTGIVFDPGTAQLRPESEQALRDLVQALNSPEAADLRVLVVGRTDDRLIARRPARENYPKNLYLGADRALAVCDQLRRLGLAEARMAVVGLGGRQAVGSGQTGAGQQEGHAVELLVMAPEVPIVGCGQTVRSVY